MLFQAILVKLLSFEAEEIFLMVVQSASTEILRKIEQESMSCVGEGTNFSYVYATTVIEEIKV